jgi:hypothetical protein
MTVSVAISAVALAISVIVFYDNRMRQVDAARLGRRPMLVFTWDASPHHAWVLSNIGLGPALDVVAAQRIHGEWRHALRLPELGVGDSTVVPRGWFELSAGPDLGVRYRSVTGERYSTRTGDDWSQSAEGWNEFPTELWQHIEPHWLYREPAPPPS